MSLLSDSVLSALTTLLLIWGLLYARSSAEQKPLPPGPKPLPLIGNLLYFPSRAPWLSYMTWAKDFGTDILHLRLFRQSLIILNTKEVCTDMLDKRSYSYSTRPSLTMAYELMGWDTNLGLMPYGDKWRACRRVIHSHTNNSAIHAYIRPLQSLCVHRFMRRMHTSETHTLEKEARLLASSLLLGTAYGIVPESSEDAYVLNAEAAMFPFIRAAAPGAYWVNVFPSLKYIPDWMPGARFKRDARVWRKLAQDMVEVPFQAVQAAMVSGRMLVCCHSTQEKKTITNAAGTIYAAGIDPLLATILHFFRAVLDRPDVQDRAADEITASVGLDRLPTLDDMPRLSFITAILLEILRHRPIAPLGFPHAYAGEEADTFNGYKIPKASIVLANIWSAVYPDPHEFRPERFLNPDGTLNDQVPNPCDLVFGFGRRVCVGRELAYTSVWLTIACVLRVYKVGKVPGDNPSSRLCTVGLGLAPARFRCTFTPRDAEAEALMEATASTVD
ncbi:cytochrome P450 [Schizophyllum commune]